MMKIYGIFLTLMSGIFFLMGGIISHTFKNKNKLEHFSIGLAFIVMVGLIFLDILPEALELMANYKIIEKISFLLIFIILGFMVLKILDLFIPAHEHKHKDNEKNKEEHKGHIVHIETLTTISLIFHNVLEGFMIVGLANNNFKVGLLLSLSIALHNIPLGMHIFSSIEFKDNKLLVSELTLSSLIGGLIFLLEGTINNLIL